MLTKIIYYKNLKNILNIILIIIIIVFNIRCSTLQNISNKYHDTDQGHYLNTYDIQKIHIGMTKAEISYNIGSPTLQDLFGENKWYYIYYHRYHNKIVKQQIFILKFDENNTLIDLKNNSIQ